MNIQDISAINDFIPDTHLFSVKKEKDGKSHLELIPKSRWNRFRRHFSCSNVSMDKVNQYVIDARLFENLPSELNQDKLQLFQQKIDSYQNHQARSFCGKLYAKICWLFSCLICCRTKPEPLAPVPPKRLRFVLPTDPALKSKVVSNRKAFINKFGASAPARTFSSGQFNQNISDSAYFKAECARLQTFLSERPPAKNSEADLVYVCMGHGKVDEQVWPGFVLEHLQNGKTVHALLFEQYFCKYGGVPAITKLDEQYERYAKANGQLCIHLDLFSVDQFLCGLPRGDAQSYDEIPEEARQLIQSGGTSNTHWETRNQITEVHKNFALYVQTVLAQGKKVVLADHSGGLALTDPLVKIYNELIKTYPNQLHFLWGWEDVNRMTNQPITQADTNRYTKTAIWNYYPPAEGGLNRCELY